MTEIFKSLEEDINKIDNIQNWDNKINKMAEFKVKIENEITRVGNININSQEKGSYFICTGSENINDNILYDFRDNDEFINKIKIHNLIKQAKYISNKPNIRSI